MRPSGRTYHKAERDEGDTKTSTGDPSALRVQLVASARARQLAHESHQHEGCVDSVPALWLDGIDRRPVCDLGDDL